MLTLQYTQYYYYSSLPQYSSSKRREAESKESGGVKMKIRENSYELMKVKIGENYNQLAQALEQEAMIHSKVDNKEQFYMPGGKVTLQLRTSNNTVFLDVTRTSFFQPKYVNEIVEKFGGMWRESCQKTVNPMSSIDVYVK